MLKSTSIGIHPMVVQIAWLLTSTPSKKLYAYLATDSYIFIHHHVYWSHAKFS